MLIVICHWDFVDVCYTGTADWYRNWHYCKAVTKKSAYVEGCKEPL